jgi:hypothetical protein
LKKDFVVESYDPCTKFSNSGLQMKDKHSNFENMRQESEQRLKRAFNSMFRRSVLEQSFKSIKSKNVQSRYHNVSSKRNMNTIKLQQLTKNTLKSIPPLKTAVCAVTELQVGNAMYFILKNKVEKYNNTFDNN